MDAEANTMAVDMRISMAEVGLVWIDDIELGYVGVGNGPVTP